MNLKVPAICFKSYSITHIKVINVSLTEADVMLEAWYVYSI